MHHDAIEKHVNKRLEYSSATIFLIPTGHKIGQKSVQIIVLLRGDVTKRKNRTTGPEAWSGWHHRQKQTGKMTVVALENQQASLHNRWSAPVFIAAILLRFRTTTVIWPSLSRPMDYRVLLVFERRQTNRHRWQTKILFWERLFIVYSISIENMKNYSLNCRKTDKKTNKK